MPAHIALDQSAVLTVPGAMPNFWLIAMRVAGAT
jgi:hypothetical protein